MFTTCFLTNTVSATTFRSNIFCFVTHYVNIVVILILVVTRTLKSNALHLEVGQSAKYVLSEIRTVVPKHIVNMKK